MVFLSGHSYLHILNNMRFWSIEKSWINTDANESLEYLSTAWVQLQEMAM